MEKRKKGFYIVFEGGEGCNKAQQASLLCQYLRLKKIPCEFLREPGYIETSNEINNILFKNYRFQNITEALLFGASRAELFKNFVKPTLEKGITIVSSSSSYTTKAYQGYGSKVNLELIKLMNKKTTFGINPDLMFIIDIDPKIGLDKKKKDKFESRGLKYHERVRGGYLKIAEEKKEICIILNYNSDEKITHEEVIKNLERRLLL